jgi:hypothetical protein
VEKTCYTKRDNLEEEVKHLEGVISVVCRPIDNFTFQVGTSQSLLSHSMQNKLVVESRCTHHMDNDSSFFTSLNEAEERNIYIADDFALDIAG